MFNNKKSIKEWCIKYKIPLDEAKEVLHLNCRVSEKYFKSYLLPRCKQTRADLLDIRKTSKKGLHYAK